MPMSGSVNFQAAHMKYPSLETLLIIQIPFIFTKFDNFEGLRIVTISILVHSISVVKYPMLGNL